MAERTPAYSFPEPESDLRPVVVESESNFGIASASMSPYEQLSFRVGRTFRGAKSATRTASTRMKEATIGMVEEHPIHFVVGVTIAAFIAGAGLRIWRSRHE